MHDILTCYDSGGETWQASTLVAEDFRLGRVAENIVLTAMENSHQRSPALAVTPLHL